MDLWSDLGLGRVISTGNDRDKTTIANVGDHDAGVILCDVKNFRLVICEILCGANLDWDVWAVEFGS